MWHFHFQDVADMLKTPLSAHLAQLEHCKKKKNQTLPVNFFFQISTFAAQFFCLGGEGGVRSYHPAVMTPCRNSQEKCLKSLLLKLRLFPVSQRSCVHSLTMVCRLRWENMHQILCRCQTKGTSSRKGSGWSCTSGINSQNLVGNCSPSADHIRNYLDDKGKKK